MNRRSAWQTWFVALVITWLLGFGTGFSLHYAMGRSGEEPVSAPGEEPIVTASALEESAAPEPLPSEMPAEDEPPPSAPVESDAQALPEESPEEEASVEMPGAEVPEPSPDEFAAAQADAAIGAASHLFIAVNGQWLAQGTREFLKELKPGGVVLREANLRSASQTLALVREIKEAYGEGLGFTAPPLIAVEREGGRLNLLGLAEAPSAAELGLTLDTDRARRLGRAYAETCVARGINVVFSPVLDVYEPETIYPSLEFRAFGADQAVVATMGLALAEGLMEGGVIPVGKHFPGHGAATYGQDGLLVVLDKDIRGLAENLFPFSEAVSHGIPGILVGHVAVPVLDKDEPTRPASLSPVLVNTILRERWGFEGVIVADEMALNAVTRERTVERSAVEALAAGCDIIVFLDPNPNRIRAVCEAITEAVRDGRLTKDSLDASKARLAGWRKRLEHPGRLKSSPSKLLPSVVVAKKETPREEDSSPELEVRPAETIPVPVEAPQPTQPPRMEVKSTQLSQMEVKPVQPPHVEVEPVPEEPPIAGDAIASADTGKPAPAETSSAKPTSVGVAITAPIDGTAPEEEAEEVPAEETEPTLEAKEVASPERTPESEPTEIAGTPEPDVATALTKETPPAEDTPDETIVDETGVVQAEMAQAETPENTLPDPMDEIPAPDESEVLTAKAPAEPTVPDTNAEQEEPAETAESETVPEVLEQETIIPEALEEEVIAGEPTPPAEKTIVVATAEDPPPEQEEVAVEETPPPTGAIEEPAEPEQPPEPDPTPEKSAPLEAEAREEAALVVAKVEPEPSPETATPRGVADLVKVEHVVRPGENLGQIAALYGVRASSIQAWNDLPGLDIRYGAVLDIHLPPKKAEEILATRVTKEVEVEEIQHTVRTNETLTYIAKLYEVELRDVVRWNRLSDARLTTGQELTIYIGLEPETVVKPTPLKKPNTTYRVRRGDTLNKVAQKHGTTVKALLKLNALKDPNHIWVGQRLKVPNRP